jgi:hypothetical protein
VADRFERIHEKTIWNYAFEQGDLVLMQNTRIEKSLNRKMRAQYLGPLIVVSKNKGGTYILYELDGLVLQNPVAGFRVIPYFARRRIELPEGLQDISTERLRQMEAQELLGEEEEWDPRMEEISKEEMEMEGIGITQ